MNIPTISTTIIETTRLALSKLTSEPVTFFRTDVADLTTVWEVGEDAYAVHVTYDVQRDVTIRIEEGCPIVLPHLFAHELASNLLFAEIMDEIIDEVAM